MLSELDPSDKLSGSAYECCWNTKIDNFFDYLRFPDSELVQPRSCDRRNDDSIHSPGSTVPVPGSPGGCSIGHLHSRQRHFHV